MTKEAPPKPALVPGAVKFFGLHDDGNGRMVNSMGQAVLGVDYQTGTLTVVDQGCGTPSSADDHPPIRKTFLFETKEAIRESGHLPSDIRFIGSRDSGHRCTWDEFRAISDFDYDPESGTAMVVTDLIIVFFDGCLMWREDRRGLEYWDYTGAFTEPEKSKPITRLLVTPSEGSCTLSEANPEPSL